MEWTVKHRYSAFSDLHATLVEEAGVPRESLPAKKILGNKDPGFILRRRRDLEAYLTSTFDFLHRALPAAFAVFLDLPRYDVNYILRDLAALHFDRLTLNSNGGGDEVDDASNPATFEASWSPLHLYSVSERLRSPMPPQDGNSGARYDFANVADHVCQMRGLRLTGDKKCLGSSNIVPDRLVYDFHPLKCLTKLILVEVEVSPEVIRSLGRVRATLTHLSANRCALKSVAHMLLCDTPHASLFHEVESEAEKEEKDADLARLVEENYDSWQWPKLETLDLR